jgi:serine/threonine protein phosphatase PrpC
VRDEGRVGPIEWAVAGQPVAGEDVSGDHWVVLDAGGAALLGVIDGLGHGEQAAIAAHRAADKLAERPGEPLDALMQRCHDALTKTRGAAMSLAQISFAHDALSWLGVGNVRASLVRAVPSGPVSRAAALLHGGVVGYRLPPQLRAQTLTMRPGDLLVMASDGLTDAFADDPQLAQSAGGIAEDILSRHNKGTDDAMVLAARHRGTPP